jgi:hypothetical protein
MPKINCLQKAEACVAAIKAWGLTVGYEIDVDAWMPKDDFDKATGEAYYGPDYGLFEFELSPMDDSEFFAHDRMTETFRKVVMDALGPKFVRLNYRNPIRPEPGTYVVNFSGSEIEVYRQK